MNIIESGKIWPIGISLAIVGVIGLGTWTIMETKKADIQQSDAYMANYQTVDANANNIINQQIAFDKAYKLKFVSEKISQIGGDVKYALTTKDGKAVSGAKMILKISRPETEIYTKIYKDPKFQNGVYVFENIAFPKKGVWNLELKVEVGNMKRFYPIKADTRIANDKRIKEASQTTYQRQTKFLGIAAQNPSE
ncbi:hypothetical protein MNB_SM-3-867 [hydrothermal vent metagenome]|uniref:YtkA-like domain-containing protein n=1 Tax=hydrothermal vent metagenome TaxID=652676 RepID=A0A1W1D675_9ZZZZ